MCKASGVSALEVPDAAARQLAESMKALAMMQAAQPDVTPPPTSDDKAAAIRRLNDAFRQDPVQGLGVTGRVVFTPGISAMSRGDRNDIFQLVREFGAFDEGNDPWGEHDFGAFTFKGQKVFWKLDYYDRDCKEGSPDPTDPAVTCRVLTVMMADEY